MREIVSSHTREGSAYHTYTFISALLLPQSQVNHLSYKVINTHINPVPSHENTMTTIILNLPERDTGGELGSEDPRVLGCTARVEVERNGGRGDRG